MLAVHKFSKLIRCSTSALPQKGLKTFFIARVSAGNRFSWPALEVKFYIQDGQKVGIHYSIYYILYTYFWPTLYIR
jgi:hypothetical protein